MANKWKYEKLPQNEEDSIIKTNLNNFGENYDQNYLYDEHKNLNKDFSLDFINYSRDANFISSQADNNFDNSNFSDNDKKYELKQRIGETKSNNKKSLLEEPLVELINYTIKPNDTLLGISLNCNCTVAYLKRINKIISDQDFYGLRYLKIPLRKYGLLSEVLIHQFNNSNETNSITQNFDNQNSNNQFDEKEIHLDNNQFNELQSKTTDQNLICFDESLINSENILDIPSSKSSSKNSLVINVGFKKTFEYDKNNCDLKNYLSYLDKDLEKIRETTNNYKSIIEPLNTYELNQFNEISMKSHNNSVNCNGADCGLNWTLVLFLAIFICVLAPLIYTIIWAEENSSNYHHIH